MYGPNYQGEIPGWIYIPGLDQYYMDPAYWTKFYQDRGILPKPVSQSKMLLNDLTNLAVTEAGREIIGSLFSGGEGSGGLFSKIGEALGITQGASGSSGLGSTLLSSIANVATETAGKLGSMLGLGSQAELFHQGSAIGQTLSGQPIFPGQTAAEAAKGSILSQFANSPVANAFAAFASGYDAYKAGKPTARGLIGSALLALHNPVAGIISVGANLLGGLLGKRRKKRKIRKWARNTAAELGFPDQEALYHYLKGNYKKFSDSSVFQYLDPDEYNRAYNDLAKKIQDIYSKNQIAWTPEHDLELKKAILDKLLFNYMKERRFMNLADKYGLKEVEDLLMGYLG